MATVLPFLALCFFSGAFGQLRAPHVPPPPPPSCPLGSLELLSYSECGRCTLENARKEFGDPGGNLVVYAYESCNCCFTSIPAQSYCHICFDETWWCLLKRCLGSPADEYIHRWHERHFTDRNYESLACPRGSDRLPDTICDYQWGPCASKECRELKEYIL